MPYDRTMSMGRVGKSGRQGEGGAGDRSFASKLADAARIWRTDREESRRRIGAVIEASTRKEELAVAAATGAFGLDAGTLPELRALGDFVKEGLFNELDPEMWSRRG